MSTSLLKPKPAFTTPAIIFTPDCSSLGMHRTHLERGGFVVTTTLARECSALVFCSDHLREYAASGAVAAHGAPKLVVGADPPGDWLRAERLAVPLLPVDLETRLVKLLRGSSASLGPTYRLLIVEDDAVTRAAVESAFEIAGFDVRSVGGFAMVQEEMKRRPDFILMDLNLPGLSGERLGEILRHQGVPIAIFSSETPERMEAARERVGAVAAFSKGTPLHAVAAQVRNHLRGLRS
jgi:CheY-like chemotaxis protein